MIVFCEKCNSKFQVDDAKIPDGGIKARCSVCSHAFILKKEPLAAAPAPAAEPAKPPAKPAPPSEFDTTVFDDAPADTHSPLMGSGGPFFFRNTPDSVSSKPDQDDVVVEIAASDGFEEVEGTAPAETLEGEGSEDIFPDEPAAADKPEPGYDAFAAFVERQKKSSPAVAASVGMDDDAPATAVREKPAKIAESAAFSAPQVPEVVTTVSGQLPANQISPKAERGIVTKLDEHGMTDDYVVQMVQEICHAVKYVEGVEKPDWPTRMMGLDMLCKIRGLYAGEKKDDSSNRQLQIVAGINM